MIAKIDLPLSFKLLLKREFTHTTYIYIKTNKFKIYKILYKHKYILFDNKQTLCYIVYKGETV